MPRGGDRYDKYEAKRRTDGRLCLDDPTDDQVCRMLAEGEADEEIIKLVEGVTVERIDALRNQPLAHRRIGWLKKQIERDNYEPETPDECLSFVKRKLVHIAKNAEEEKNKIAALKALSG